MTKLQKLPSISPEFMKPDYFYIWHLPHGEKKVCWLNDQKDGISTYDSFKNTDDWYFEDNLVGEIYGPFQINILEMMSC